MLRSVGASFSPHDPTHRYERFIEHVTAVYSKLGRIEAAAIAERLRSTRAMIAKQGLTDERVAEAFALIKLVCARELGIDLFPTQLRAALIMLDRRLAEMATGEGKTLAASLCAATAALAGIPVHVITANEYLVTRDADSLRPLYSALGLTVSSITQSMDSARRRQAYDCNVVYCTANELVFDYLRDGLVRGRSRGDLHQRVSTLGASDASDREVLLRGLCMAIVDEADSILIDDARVPLLLSERRSNDGERRYYADALGLGTRLTAGVDFILHAQNMSAQLTPRGRTHLEQLAASLNGAWHNRLHRDETVCTALAALHLYEKDRHYLVRNGAVTIIDQSTGRLATGRIWSRGLHLLIELKEHCDATSGTATIAQITYQRFFQRYLALGGMSGTLKEARGELLSTYGLQVVQVPLRRPDRRKVLPTRLYCNRQTRWEAVIARAMKINSTGRPVLIGTDSVAESEEASRRLTEVGLAHAVLNARNDSEEAQIIARAGQRGQITIATSMAGRGTDIKLGPGISEIGGLHVICCQHNASRRIDRQLLGRCARQGDPGSTQSLLALDSPLIARFIPRCVARRMSKSGVERPQWFVRLLLRAPQWLEEMRQRAQRRDLLCQDLRVERSLSFGRPME